MLERFQDKWTRLSGSETRPDKDLGSGFDSTKTLKTLDSDRITKAALSWAGTPYRHQASLLGVGCDCLGLIRGVWRTLYGFEPALTPPYPQFGRDKQSASLLLDAAQKFFIPCDNKAAAGRLILFQLHQTIPPRHCGIILDEKTFIHAQERLGVVVAALDDNWRKRIHSTFAFPCFPQKRSK